MAERSDDKTWWEGWIQTAKEKSASALEFVRKDLAEFTCAMQTESACVSDNLRQKLTGKEMQETAAAASSKVKDGVSRFFGGITKVLTIPPDENDDRSEVIGGPPMYDRAKARLHAIQLDPGTYLDEPPGSPEEFAEWKKGFDLDFRKGDISELLVANVEVRGLYTQLVPSQVSHANFWHRYFFRVHQLEQDQVRRAELMKRADVSQTEQELAWDDDEWGDVEGPPSPQREGSPSKIMPDTRASKTHKPREGGIDHGGVAQPVIQEPAPSTQTRGEGQAQLAGECAQHIHTDITATGQPQAAPDTKRLTGHLENVALTETKSAEKNTESAKQVEPQTGVVEVRAIKDSDETQVKPSQTVSKVDDQPEVTVSETPHASPSLVITKPSAVGVSSATDSKMKDTKERQKVELKAANSELGTSELRTKDKGDMVVVGTSTPTSSHSGSSASSNGKDATSLDEDWEKDFDVEVTEEDLRLAQEAARLLKEKAGVDQEDDDWENWE